MKNQTDNTKRLKFLALSYGLIFIFVGILGIIFLLFLDVTNIIIDPIEQLIIILIGIIFLRGYNDLNKQKGSGKAFMFVGTIIGIVLGILASLEFFFVGLIEGLLNKTSLDEFTSHFLSYLLNPALILGFLTFIPHKLMKQRENIKN